MKKTVHSTRLTLQFVLKAGISVLAFMGVLPALQANTKIDSAQVRRMEDIRLRLLRNDARSIENPYHDEGEPSEEHVASWCDIFDWPSWSTWNNWGNGWRNY